MTGRATVRMARADDAAAGIAVLRASITGLCTLDHANDPAVLSRWLANKTAETWGVWLREPDAVLCVAEFGRGMLCGVGMLGANGEVLLMYVAPDARFAGVSTALLAYLEAHAARRGMTRVWLDSTRTAAPFYAARGYHAAPGDPLRFAKHLTA